MAAECRNPECRNGFCPGILTSGRGSPNAPIVGAVMRWGWVNCRACKPQKDAPYASVHRTPQEIAERARLADAKAPYDQKAEAKRASLEKIRSNIPSSAAAPTSSANSVMVEKLLSQNEKLTDQVAALFEENRQLRSQLSGNALPAQNGPAKKGRKKAVKKGVDDDTQNSSANPRSLS